MSGDVDSTRIGDAGDVDGRDAPSDQSATDDGDVLGVRLLEAAAAVFAERGYDKAGVAEIARRAGVTTGAIYSRYSGKAELLVEAIDPHATDELESLFTDHDFQGRMEDILLTAGTHLVKRGREADDPSQAPLLLEAFVAARRHAEVGEVLRSRVVERQNRLTAIVEAAKADGGLDAGVDTDSLVAFCHALAFGFLLFEATALPLPTPGPWEQLITRLVDALRPTTDSHTETPRGS